MMPNRTLDTMSEAISLSSPGGHISKRARIAATEKLRIALFGHDGLQRPVIPQPSDRERLLNQARELRELAARGMKPRAYRKKADELERLANEEQ